jgi:DNA polymerase III epsilon subunit-like protein
MQRIIVVDTETTGFSPKTEEIVEIAFIEIDENFNELSRFEAMVNPGVPISPGASAVNGITDEDVVDCLSMEETLQNFGPDYFKDVFLIAHSARFDRSFLKKFWNITGELCTLKAARQLYPEAENHKLQTLRYWLKLDNAIGERKDNLAHSAMGDVVLLLALLKRMVKDSGKPLAVFHEDVDRPKEIIVMPFGKHKGMKLRSLPKAYVTWLLNLDRLDGDLEASLRKL